MKKIALLALALTLTGCAAKNPVVADPFKKHPKPIVDFTITVKFNFDYTNNFQCSATITKGCISGFTWGYLQGGNQVPLRTAAPNSICTGSTQPQSCSDTVNNQLPIGSLTFYSVANYVDNNGVVGASVPGLTATPSVVAAGAPTNVTESHQ